MNNQNKSAGFNYIALLTQQEINGNNDNPSGEEGCIKKLMQYQSKVYHKEERWWSYWYQP